MSFTWNIDIIIITDIIIINVMIKSIFKCVG